MTMKLWELWYFLIMRNARLISSTLGSNRRKTEASEVKALFMLGLGSIGNIALYLGGVPYSNES